jgi:hypothetical protein
LPQGKYFTFCGAKYFTRRGRISPFIVRGVKRVEILRVKLILRYAHRITNLTKSKRCPKTLDT